MSNQPSFLCSIPLVILENIAHEASLLDPVGPPAIIVPLLQTCRHIHAALSFKTCSHLYARIFRSRFDYRSASRRFGNKAAFSQNLAKQLKKYCKTLKFIRRGDIRSDSHSLTEHFWVAFFMMAENDGRNYVQLQWASLPAFVDRFVRERLWDDRQNSNGWPAESSINSLALWLLYFTTTPETLAAESPEERRALMERVRPYVVTAPRYPSFHAPDNHFEFPLNEELGHEFPYTFVTPHGFYPLYRQPEHLVETHKHYGMKLEIAAPPITIAAKQLYFSRSEITPYEVPTNIPLDRVAASAMGQNFPSPTQVDFIEFNFHRGVKPSDLGSWDWRSQLSEEEGQLEDDGVWRKGLKSKSANWDNDWQRWTYCWDPWSVPSLKGVVYTYGTLEGLWTGRMLIPDMTQYQSLIKAAHFPPNFSPQNPNLTTMPLYMRLREHHCISPEFPVLTGGDHDGFDDGIRNGWFPKVNIHESGGTVRVEDCVHEYISKYETYVEGRPNSHREESCSQCVARRHMEEQELKERVRALERSSEERNIAEKKVEPEERAKVAEIAKSDSKRQLLEFSDDLLQRLPITDQSSEGYGSDEDEDADTVDDDPVPAPGSSIPPADRPESEEPTTETIKTQVSAALGPGVNVDDVLDHEMGGDASEGSSSEDDNTDSDSEVDYVENTCNGIQDIIITGETLPRHGQAWHHYRFYGRVRHWDGLIALVRVPIVYPELGVMIFRGYVTGNRNFVGAWRAFTTNVHTIPLEGPFVVSKASSEAFTV